jgi:hypothetical protein
MYHTHINGCMFDYIFTLKILVPCRQAFFNKSGYTIIGIFKTVHMRTRKLFLGIKQHKYIIVSQVKIVKFLFNFILIHFFDQFSYMKINISPIFFPVKFLFGKLFK